MPRSPSKRGQKVKEDVTTENKTKSQHKVAFVKSMLEKCTRWPMIEWTFTCQYFNLGTFCFSNITHCLYLLSDSLLTSNNIEVVKLRNPHTDEGTMYIIDKDKITVHEIMAFDEGYRYVPCVAPSA